MEDEKRTPEPESEDIQPMAAQTEETSLSSALQEPPSTEEPLSAQDPPSEEPELSEPKSSSDESSLSTQEASADEEPAPEEPPTEGTEQLSVASEEATDRSETEALLPNEELDPIEEEKTEEPFATDAPSEVDTVVPQIEKASMAGGILLTKRHLVIAVIVAVVLMVGGVVLGMNLTKKDPLMEGIDPDAVEYSGIQANAGNASADTIAVPGYDSLAFKAGRQDAQMVLSNPDGNPCYFTYSLILSDTGEELYRSGLIPPGMAVVDITLSRPLDSGDYRLQIFVETSSLSDRSPMNSTGFEVKLTVR